MRRSRLIGAAVVGRNFGARVQVPSLRAAGFDVRVIVGTDETQTAKTARELGIPRSSTSLTDAMKGSGVDAVCIAAPLSVHAELTMEAIEAGRHILCEKPFTMQASEAAQLLHAATWAGVVHAVGHEFRWMPTIATVAMQIRNGSIGIPTMISLVEFMDYLRLPGVSMPHWFTEEDAGGGWLAARGSHSIDQLLWWLGPWASVSVNLISAGGEPRLPDHGYVVKFDTRAGAHGVLEQASAAWIFASMSVVVGTAGAIGIDGGEVWLADLDGRRTVTSPSGIDPIEIGPIDGSDTVGAQAAVEVGHYTRLCAAFRSAILGQPEDPAVPLPTFEDGLASMDVMDAIRTSALAGGAIIAVADRATIETR